MSRLRYMSPSPCRGACGRATLHTTSVGFLWVAHVSHGMRQIDSSLDGVSHVCSLLRIALARFRSLPINDLLSGDRQPRPSASGLPARCFEVAYTRLA